MPKRGKKYQEAVALVDRSHVYSPEEALEMAKKTSYASFDTTVEIHMRMGLDPRHADQMVRGTIVLPHGTGKSKRVAVIASGEKTKEAEEAGADYVIIHVEASDHPRRTFGEIRGAGGGGCERLGRRGRERARRDRSDARGRREPVAGLRCHSLDAG